MRIKFDKRKKVDGLWLYGITIELFGIGVRIHLYSYRQWKGYV